MGFPYFFNKYFTLTIVVLLSMYFVCFAQYDPPTDDADSVQEMEALLSLKAMFNDSFLNKNWTAGLHCYNWYGIQCSDDDRVIGISLPSMDLSGNASADVFMNFLELTLINLKNNSLSGNIMNFLSNRKLKHVDLSGNMFYGPISPSLLSLNMLESLLLQDNSLTGPLPEFNQSSLREFNVSNNNLSGPIPATQTLQKFGIASYFDNPELCGPPSLNPCSFSENDTSDSDDHSDPSKISMAATMFLIVDVVGFVAVMLLFMLYCKKARKLKKMMKSMQKDITEEAEAEAEEAEVVVVQEKKQEKKKLTFMEGEEARFELNDLLKASAEGLGKGIFGISYKANLEGSLGGPVVVKRLRDLKPLSNEEFTEQLHSISHYKHPNLLPLLAYYYSNEEKFLVYKYAVNGNLFNRIHGDKSSRDRIPFRWSARLSVARGVARGLEYLHLNTKSQSGVVPHGNLKSTNILLDEDEMVLVSDYGLSSLVAVPIAAQRMVSYKSPEYQFTKRVSKKSDVWSYGCLLLELLTARVSVHSAPPGINGVDLSSWVPRAVREEWTAEIFDQEISVERSDVHSMLRLLQIALHCCDKSPEKRPEMTEVVREVENIKVVESESEDFSEDQSLTDETLSITAPAMVADHRRR